MPTTLFALFCPSLRASQEPAVALLNVALPEVGFTSLEFVLDFVTLHDPRRSKNRLALPGGYPRDNGITQGLPGGYRGGTGGNPGDWYLGRGGSFMLFNSPSLNVDLREVGFTFFGFLCSPSRPQKRRPPGGRIYVCFCFLCSPTPPGIPAGKGRFFVGALPDGSI